MPARATMPPGAPIWNDLGTSDVPRSVAFYGELFGWEFRDFGEEFGHYGVLTHRGAAVAGLGPLMAEGQPVVWSVYLYAPDVADTLARARAAGAEVMVDAMAIPGQGVMAMVGDPSGAAVGLWEPAGMAGFEVADEPGTPVWHELLTRDIDAALPFYEGVMGWTTRVESDAPGFRYLVQESGGQELAGLMDASTVLPEGIPSYWGVYFGVEDADAAAERVVALGGSVLQGPLDSAHGRVAVVADPLGATFSVITPVART
ncbi:VOC family protein [Oerskovia flava]|uniref:VOC family protein n=1 Tax=Oerskovia flava TaxID=2986422 RepID=UPI0022404360|nr:VOC family protein [Oerskovia sp. JB1-3-2]